MNAPDKVQQQLQRQKTLVQAFLELGTQITRFTSTKVRTLTPELGTQITCFTSTQITCFTSTKVRTLTPELRLGWVRLRQVKDRRAVPGEYSSSLKALLRLYSGSFKALFRILGSIKALLSMKALLRRYEGAISAF